MILPFYTKTHKESILVMYLSKRQKRGDLTVEGPAFLL